LHDPFSGRGGRIFSDARGTRSTAEFSKNTGDVWTTAGGTQDSAPVTPEQRAQGFGTHLHWDKSTMIDGVREYFDPLGGNN